MAAFALARSAPGMPESSPAAASRVQRSADLLARLLDDLIELARLEAGQERRHVAPFDAARVVTDLCEALQPLAAERGLFLRVDTPASLPVEGAALKAGRIAQNLLLNALKYTEHGGVHVTCAEVAVGEVPSWLLCVQDTGVGFGHGGVTPLALVISDATEEAQSMARDAAARATAAGAAPLREVPRAVPMLRSQSDERPPDAGRSAGGEGIGLAIVKRLCELLDASLELQSEPGRGTTFRIVFPKRY
jgi:signal transduction histidine kinase